MLDDQSEKYHIYKTALAKWGRQAQVNRFFEKSSKLTTVLAKSSRPKEQGTDKADIAEGIAEMEIMLELMIMLFDCKGSVGSHKREKLLRLRERIKN